MVKVTIVGRLTSDAKEVTTKDGKPYVAFDLASNEWTKNGEVSVFYRVMSRGRYGSDWNKGDTVCVIGNLGLKETTLTSDNGKPYRSWAIEKVLSDSCTMIKRKQIDEGVSSSNIRKIEDDKTSFNDVDIPF